MDGGKWALVLGGISIRLHLEYPPPLHQTPIHSSKPYLGPPLPSRLHPIPRPFICKFTLYQTMVLSSPTLQLSIFKLLLKYFIFILFS